MKTCLRCQQKKDESAFHKKGIGQQPWCKACHNAYQRATRKRRETPERRRASNLKTRYGITAADVQAMIDKQGGACGICQASPIKRPVVDHDHVTGKVRGILCHACNIVLPVIEREGFLAAARRYLDASK